MTCTCPQYHIPSANPNDSIGCPEHDPNYVDPDDIIEKLRKELVEANKTIAKLKGKNKRLKKENEQCRFWQETHDAVWHLLAPSMQRNYMTAYHEVVDG